MKFSYSWLKELVDIKLSPEKLAELLSEHAFEVESGKQSIEFQNIIVARVTKVDKHPNADRLRVIELTDDTNVFGPVVCGAWNFDVGAIVPLALPGATIPHNQHDPEGASFVLGKAKIRGVESQGMICSSKELGLGENGDGILLLDETHQLGQPFSVEGKHTDTLLDISIPANRPDLMGYLGVAREISAITEAKLKYKPAKASVNKLKSKVLQVQVSSPKLCPTYQAVRLVGVRVEESPKYIQERLLSVGMKSINNVVDITNLVMLETGQPLHAFDASKIIGAIKVREAFVNEKITTLDNIPRVLSSDTLVIADSKKPIGIAGIMGGLETAVNIATTEIILESANFNSVSIRKTYKRLGLRTDAAVRFEKGVPQAFVPQALEQAVSLLVKHASAKAVEFAENKPLRLDETSILLDPNKTNQLLGFEVKPAEQKRVLTKFGFVVAEKKGLFEVTIPNWRTDVRIWQDLVEEIARFIGLNKIPQTPTLLTPSTVQSDPLLTFADEVRDMLISLGYYESYTYSFTSKFEDNSVEVENPISADSKYLRTSVGINYQPLVEQNARYIDQQALFEIGNVYSQAKNEIKEQTNLYLANFSKTDAPEIKLLGDLKELLNSFGIQFTIEQNLPNQGFVRVGNLTIGSIRVTPSKTPWAEIELSLEKLGKLVQPKTFTPIPRFPSKKIDLAILVGEDVSWQSVKTELEKLKISILSSIELVEIYKGKSIALGKKSLTIGLTFQSPERTLTDEEVSSELSQITQKLKTELNAETRD